MDQYGINEKGLSRCITINGKSLSSYEVVDKLNELTKDKISFANELNKFESQVEETLQKHYNYANSQRQKNLDNVMVHQAYDVLRATIRDIADELEIDLKNKEVDYKSAFNKGMDHVIKNHPEGLFK